MDAESLRKAAILINALDAQTADRILDQMGEERAAAVRRAVMDLVDVDPAEQKAVIENFLASQRGTGKPAPLQHAASQHAASQHAASQRDDSQHASAHAHETDAHGARQGAAADTNEPASHKSPSEELFDFLHHAPAEAVHGFLAPEHPQTVAIVLAHLPPKQASDVLRRCTAEQQTDLLRRIAKLNGADVEILRDVEQEMRRVFSQRTFRQADAQGVSSLQAILAATDEKERGDWLKDIEQFDPSIAEQLHASEAEPPQQAFPNRFPRLGVGEPGETRHASQPSSPSAEWRPDRSSAAESQDVHGEQAAFERIDWRRRDAFEATLDLHDDNSNAPAQDHTPTLSFADLSRLDDSSLAQVLQNSDGQIVLVALAGATRAFVERLLRQLPTKAARSLNERIEKVGPLRLKDVELAQQKLAHVAERLAEEGKIELPVGARFAAAA